MSRIVFFANFALGIYSIYPTAAERAAAKVEIDDMQYASDNNSEREWEMKNVSAAKQPFTPRTLAFNTLDRKLPLRATEKKVAARFA